MRSMMFAMLIAFATAPAIAQDSEKPVKHEKEFKPPPGYRTKTPGDQTVYCRKDTISGSRFGTEKCYTEEQLEQKAAENEAARQEVERSTRVCSNEAACGNR